MSFEENLIQEAADRRVQTERDRETKAAAQLESARAIIQERIASWGEGIGILQPLKPTIAINRRGSDIEAKASWRIAGREYRASFVLGTGNPLLGIQFTTAFMRSAAFEVRIRNPSSSLGKTYNPAATKAELVLALEEERRLNPEQPAQPPSTGPRSASATKPGTWAAIRSWHAELDWPLPTRLRQRKNLIDGSSTLTWESRGQTFLCWCPPARDEHQAHRIYMEVPPGTASGTDIDGRWYINVTDNIERVVEALGSPMRMPSPKPDTTGE